MRTLPEMLSDVCMASKQPHFWMHGPTLALTLSTVPQRLQYVSHLGVNLLVASAITAQINGTPHADEWYEHSMHHNRPWKRRSTLRPWVLCRARAA